MTKIRTWLLEIWTWLILFIMGIWNFVCRKEKQTSAPVVIETPAVIDPVLPVHRTHSIEEIRGELVRGYVTVDVFHPERKLKISSSLLIPARLRKEFDQYFSGEIAEGDYQKIEEFILSSREVFPDAHS